MAIYSFLKKVNTARPILRFLRKTALFDSFCGKFGKLRKLTTISEKTGVRVCIVRVSSFAGRRVADGLVPESSEFH